MKDWLNAPDAALEGPLRLVMEEDHLNIAIYALGHVKTFARRGMLAQSPFSSTQAVRAVGLIEQSERRLVALKAPEAIRRINAILAAIADGKLCDVAAFERAAE